MKNAIGELFGKECVVTVTDNPHISDGVFNLPVDAKGVVDGTSVSNIVISVPVGVLDSNRCMRGQSSGLHLSQMVQVLIPLFLMKKWNIYRIDVRIEEGWQENHPISYWRKITYGK